MTLEAERGMIIASKSVDSERVLAFSGGSFSASGWPRPNIHTSMETAARTGISEMVISGHQVEAYVVSAMGDHFGQRWWEAGSLWIKFIRPVAVGETLVLKITSKSEDGQTLKMEVIGDKRGIASVAEGSLRSEMESQVVYADIETYASLPIKDRINQAHLSVGDRYAPYQFTISKVLNDQYLFAVEDYSPQYVNGTAESGRPDVHPAALLNTANITKSPSHYAPPGTHSMFAEDRLVFISRATVDDALRVECFVTDVYGKRGRTWHSVDATIVGPDGAPILRRRTTGALQTPITPMG